MKSSMNTRSTIGFRSTVPIFLFLSTMVLNGCQNEDIEKINEVEHINPDINDDNAVYILVLGSTNSIHDTEAFSPNQIAEELQSILSEDNERPTDVHVVAQDIHQTKQVTLGLGQAGTEYTVMHQSHSLTQYYYWPEEREARMDFLLGNDSFDWDHVVIASDLYIVATMPGYYSLGVHKIASKVLEGNAQPHLLMMWPQYDSSGGSIQHFEEFTSRTSQGAKVEIPIIPVGLAWQSLPDDKKDEGALHPSPNGAYLAAAAIYSQITGKNASSSSYVYDNTLAETAYSTVVDTEGQNEYAENPSFISPFSPCDIHDEIISYHHTGSSSENGILGGLNWIFEQVPQTLQNGGETPINFNYGRANSNFEANKRYQINPELFGFSFGFPMQDNGNHGDESMLYGLDRRESGTMNDTDLGVAQFMISQSELPYARAIPIRTLFAQMKEAIPTQSAYRDAWHMHRDLDKAIGVYMYTVLTGDCAAHEEPIDQDSDEWRTWMAHKIGYETAWTLMYMEGFSPDCE